MREVKGSKTWVIGDEADDSNALDEQLKLERGTEFIATHRARRARPSPAGASFNLESAWIRATVTRSGVSSACGTSTQDGRRLRRCKRRRKVEHLFAWLMQFRRLVTRWELYAPNFEGFVHPGCLGVVLRRV